MTLDRSWLNRAVTASADRPVNGLHGSAQLLIGKVEAITVNIDDGRIVGEAVGTPQCQVSFSKPQAEALVGGELKLSVEYMRGDLKPTGSTAAIVALIDALDALRPE
ncbi:MAG: hypothetical protein ACN4GZ_06410 [Acidimicrobiales bacterium]